MREEVSGAGAKKSSLFSQLYRERRSKGVRSWKNRETRRQKNIRLELLEKRILDSQKALVKQIMASKVNEPVKFPMFEQIMELLSIHQLSIEPTKLVELFTNRPEKQFDQVAVGCAYLPKDPEMVKDLVKSIAQGPEQLLSSGAWKSMRRAI